MWFVWCVIGIGDRPEQCRVSDLVSLSKIPWSSYPLFILSIYTETVAIVVMGMTEELSSVSLAIRVGTHLQCQV